jgi:Bacterial antitoxin of type II TA system, VapB
MNKTTIELDEEKLERVMRLGAFKTRKEAIDWALTEAERLVSIKHIAETPWTPEMLKDAIDPDYDIMAVRRQSVTYSPKSRKKKS